MSKEYKIGDIAKELDVKSFVLRFWENEFKQIKPQRSEKKQRIYSEKDLILLKKIKHLLYTEGMTIDGAKKVLAKKEPEKVIVQATLVEQVKTTDIEFLSEIAKDLEEIQKLLRA